MKKKDIIYVAIIGIIIINACWVLAWKYSESSSALNYVSFAGTLVSIILAILAIGYTYGESIRQSSQGDGVTDSIRNLVNVTTEIKDASKELSTLALEINKDQNLFC